MVSNQVLRNFLRLFAQLARHESGALNAPRPLRIRLISFDAGDALACHHVEQHHGTLVLDDLTLVRVATVVTNVNRLKASPPEGDRVLETRQEVLGAVIAVIVALDEDVRI